MHLLPLQNQKNVLVSKKMTNTMTERVRIAFLYREIPVAERNEENFGEDGS